MKSKRISRLAMTFVLFAFLVISVVQANTTSEITAVGPTTIVTGTQYSGAVSCNGTRMDGKSGTARIDLDYGYLQYSSSGKIVYYPKDGTAHQTIENFSCTFEKRSNKENVTFDYKLTIAHRTADIIEDRQELTLDSPAYVLQLETGQTFTTEPQVTSGMGNTSTYFEAGNDNGTGKCTGSSRCVFKLIDGVNLPAEGVDGGYTIKFKGTDGLERTIKVILHGKMDKGVYAYGGDGTCNWSSGWVDALRTTANNKKGNTKMYMFKGVGDSVTLPTECTLDETNGSHPLPVKFAGWVELTNDGTDRQAINTCNKFPKHTVVTYEAGKQQLYGSCFTMQGVIVYGAEAIINDSNWSETKFGYYINKTENPVLPGATPRAASLNPNVEFVGYSTSNGSCEGTLKQPGEKAENGLTYYACVKYTTGLSGIINKRIKQGDSEEFKTDGANIKGCVSEDTKYVMATQSNGQCIITGVKSTTGIKDADDPSDDYVDVKVTTSRGGEQITLRVSVLADEEMPVFDWDDYTLDSSSGAQLTDELYGDREDAYGFSCGTYQVVPNGSTQRESGIVVGDAEGIPLRVHFYQGSSQCGSDSETYIGICMDPGRAEPEDSSSPYNKERELDPKNNQFDRLISYIYTDPDFLSDVNSYVPNARNENLSHLISATIAIRLGAILYDEDANNNGLGLDRYYAAYKTVAANIKSKTGGDISKTRASYLHAGNVYFNSPYDEIAASYLAGAVSYEAGSGELKFTANDTVTEWNEDKTQYTKITTGTISGLNLFTSAAIKLSPTCTGVFAGKCNLYIKNLETQEFDAYSDSINYFQNSTYMDRSGNLHYKFVMGPISAQVVANAVTEYASGGGAGTGGGAGSGGAGGSAPFDSVIDTRYASPEAAGNVLKAGSSESVNIQSMILYKKSGSVDGGCPSGYSKSGSVCCPSGYTYRSSDNKCHRNGGNPGGGDGPTGGSGGGGDDETVAPEPYTEGGDWSVELEMEADGESKPIRLVWIRRYFRIGTLLPACDITNPIFDYKNPGNGQFNQELFKAAGCCNFIFDHTSDYYKNYCVVDGVFSSVYPVCTYNESNTTGYDVTKILEAHDDENTENYSRIIDTSVNKLGKDYQDPAGNSYVLDLFRRNLYCDVSCKEDWQFNFPSLNNYVGKNAVRAGSFFVVKDKNVFIGGKRTCVTTKIDYDAYISVLNHQAPITVENFNHWQVKTAIKEAYENAEVTIGEAYEYCSGEYTSGYTDYWCNNADGTTSSSTTNCTANGGTIGSQYHEATCSETSTCKDITVDPTNYTAEYKYGEPNQTLDCDTQGGWCADAAFGEKPSKKEFTGTAMSESTAGSCDLTEDELTADAVKQKVIEEAGADDPESFKQKMMAALGVIATHTRDIKACNYWHLGSQQSESGGSVSIYTVFSPQISFEYDEEEYMKEIGSNNRLVENETLNEACRSASSECPEVAKKAEKKTTFYGCSDIDNKSYDCSDKSEILVNDGVESIPDKYQGSQPEFICSAGGEGSVIVGASKESSGSWSSWSSEDGCSEVSFDYLKVHYIKRSLEQSSYYKSKYTWYINKVTDVKIYASSLNDYARIHPGSGADEIDKWSPFGSKQVEESVFPVMVKTPRNMYKYQYTLTGVGMYSDNTVGRLMGSATSVFKNNKRICFYEVVEQICRCCADEIDTHSTVSGISDYANDGSDSRDISTAEALGVAGYDYQVSNFSSATVGSEGRLGYFGSTVTLADIMANRTDDEISSIWSKQSVYMVSGLDQITEQGDVLKEYIQKNANTIYEATPEYSYTLTPSAMSSIRRYNEAYGYQPNANTLKMYGSILYTSGNSYNWLAKMYSKGDNVSDVHFSHYGSYFLEKNVAPYVTPEYKNSVLTNKSEVCYMVEEEGKYNGSSTRLHKGNNGQTANFNECRWIDYVQATTIPKEDGNGYYYSRLAFK